MTMNFFNKPPAMPDIRRVDAVRTVQVWMWGRGAALPADLRAALNFLIPETREKQPDEFEHHGDFGD
jgi:hypothetical protein